MMQRYRFARILPVDTRVLLVLADRDVINSEKPTALVNRAEFSAWIYEATEKHICHPPFLAVNS